MENGFTKIEKLVFLDLHIILEVLKNKTSAITGLTDSAPVA